jgi:two-component system, NarL family, invasion response regulator UvrY
VSLGLSPRPTAAPSSGEPGDAPFRVLVVDDQAPFRSVAASVIRLVRGWQVVGEAETGEEAVRLTAQLEPDLVLMDINLPGINGIQATQQILHGRPGVAVVLVSTYALDDLPEEASRCGALAYVRKDDLTPRLLRSLLAR